MAQANDVTIPIASQLILNRMGTKVHFFIKCNTVAKELLLSFLGPGVPLRSNNNP